MGRYHVEAQKSYGMSLDLLVELIIRVKAA